MPMTRISLTDKSWQLCGWRPYSWQIGRSMELGMTLRCDIAPMPAVIPGSVQVNLLAAGWLKDWNHGLNSLSVEWVENRHWEFFTRFEAGQLPAGGESVTLCAGCLDHSGWILVDEQKVATFCGALKRQRIDLGTALSDGNAHSIGIVFDCPPDEQGQIGFTSRSRHFKPRYNYSWDFCPRFVPIGIGDDLWLEFGQPAAELIRITPRLLADFSTGELSAVINARCDGQTARVRVLKDGVELLNETRELTPGENALGLTLPSVEAWWPNGMGEHPLYDVSVSLVDGAEIARRRVGFKHVAWETCEGAPADALPWICVVNGRRLFLQGVNWTPLRLDYLSVTADQYRQRLDLYRDMGCNVLRVWGGAFLEREVFYNFCDEAGLLVWQEFPLSSSGIDNYPPEDPAAIAELTVIARDYVRRRCHHASRLLWCGGNELQHAEGRKDGVGIPVTLEHPCMAAFAEVVAAEDPDARCLPTSSSGPRFMAFESNYGKGQHHDVHGPWNLEKLDEWKRYWAGDDALLRSETGMPGAASLECIERYRGEESPWPPAHDNRYYMHACSWWLQWNKFSHELEGMEPDAGLKRYVELSQTLQAEALTVAATTCRDRFPRCGGILLWMGHDMFPCPSNTSIIDFDATPKLAYHAVKDVYLNAPHLS